MADARSSSDSTTANRSPDAGSAPRPRPAEAPSYRLRYFFDPGSGRCLWAGDDPTRARFDYPVDHMALPLTPTTQARIDATLTWYDTSLNWAYPPDPGPWREEECARFNATAAALYATIAAELGPAFQVRDEHRLMHEDPDLDAYLADPAHFRRD